MNNVKKMVSTVNKMETKNLDRSSRHLAIIEEPPSALKESKDENSPIINEHESKGSEMHHPSLKSSLNAVIKEDQKELKIKNSSKFSRYKMMTPSSTSKKFMLKTKYATQQLSKVNFRLEIGKKSGPKKYKAIGPSSIKGRKSLWTSQNSKRKYSRNSSSRSGVRNTFDNMVYDLDQRKKLEILKRKKHIDRMYTFKTISKPKSRKCSKNPPTNKELKSSIRDSDRKIHQDSHIQNSNILLNKANLIRKPKEKSTNRHHSLCSQPRQNSKVSLDARRSLLPKDYTMSSEDAKKVEFLAKIEKSMLKISDDQLKSISELSMFFLSKSPTRQQFAMPGQNVSFLKHN